MDWGSWDDPAGREAITVQLFAQLAAAKARGIGKAIIAVGFCLFDSAYRYRGPAELVALRQQIEAAGFGSMIVALTLVDEPDMHGCSDPLMCTAFAGARVAWPGVKLACIYGDHGTPGAEFADWIGTDNYPLGAGVLDRLPVIRADQRYIVVPGGSDPWRNDPAPFVAFAKTHDVAVVCAFTWFDRPVDEQGVPRAGIRSNGMRDAYVTAARAVAQIPA